MRRVCFCFALGIKDVAVVKGLAPFAWTADFYDLSAISVRSICGKLHTQCAKTRDDVKARPLIRFFETYFEFFGFRLWGTCIARLLRIGM